MLPTGGHQPVTFALFLITGIGIHPLYQRTCCGHVMLVYTLALPRIAVVIQEATAHR